LRLCVFRASALNFSTAASLHSRETFFANVAASCLDLSSLFFVQTADLGLNLPCVSRPKPRICACLLLLVAMSSFAQIQQAWVAKYNNGISNGNHQALKATLDSSGNIYVLGVSQNANTNTGYVTLKYSPNGVQMWAARMDTTNFSNANPTAFVLDSSNDVVVTGTSGTVKYNAQGNLLWTAPGEATFFL
jgi:hypothetical protein